MVVIWTLYEGMMLFIDQHRRSLDSSLSVSGFVLGLQRRHCVSEVFLGRRV